MNKELFLIELKKLGINCNDLQLEQLNKYYEILVKENEKYNLTAIIEEEKVYLKHFFDSLTLIKAIDLNGNLTLCDIGTGAGFPGIVLKIFFPNLAITLVDSLNKRVLFLEKVISELKLTNIQAIHDRAEIFAKDNYEKYDIVVSRAVANLSMLSELCLPIVKVNGFFLAMKAEANEEILVSNEAINKLKGKIVDKIEFMLPIENSKRTIIKIKKEATCPRIYPRNYDQIKKTPLK